MSMKVAFFGSPAFALPVLEAIAAQHEVVLVVAQPDKPVGRGLRLTPPPVAAYATEKGYALAQPTKLRGNFEFEQILRDSGADVAITCAYGKKLPLSLLQIPPHGFLNTHTSLLPRWRGAAPIQRALMAGDRVTGTTIMLTDEGMDTGDILLQESLAILPHWNSILLAEALSEQAARLIVQALSQLPHLTPTPQAGEVTHAAMLSKEDGYVRWDERAEEAVNRARGVAAWPASTAFLAGKRVKLTGIEVVDEHSLSEAPEGTMRLQGGRLFVACAAGTWVSIQTVQPETKKPISAASWAASLPEESRFDLI